VEGTPGWEPEVPNNRRELELEQQEEVVVLEPVHHRLVHQRDPHRQELEQAVVRGRELVEEEQRDQRKQLRHCC
jgi:hypothetical protein